MNDISFASGLSRRNRRDLERLLFFNVNQSRVRSEVLSVIERYGVPRITVDNGLLRVGLTSSIIPQTLFALDASDELIGVVAYTRENDKLSVLHMAVREDYTQKSRPHRTPLLLDMVGEVRRVARRIKGVSSVVLFPGTSKARRIPAGSGE